MLFATAATARLMAAILAAGAVWSGVEWIEHRSWNAAATSAVPPQPATHVVDIEVTASRDIAAWSMHIDEQPVLASMSSSTSWMARVTIADPARGGLRISAQPERDDGQEWALRVRVGGSAHREVTLWSHGRCDDAVMWAGR